MIWGEHPLFSETSISLLELGFRAEKKNHRRGFEVKGLDSQNDDSAVIRTDKIVVSDMPPQCHPFPHENLFKDIKGLEPIIVP